MKDHPKSKVYHEKFLQIFESLSKANENKEEDDLKKQKRMKETQESIYILLENNIERVQFYSEELWNQDEATKKILGDFTDVLNSTNWTSKTESIMDEKKDLLMKIQYDLKSLNDKNYQELFSLEKMSSYEAIYSS